MSEETKQEGTDATADMTAKPNEASVPYARFAEVNDGYKELKSKLERMEAENKKREEMSLIEQNKFNELYDIEKKRNEELLSELEPLRGYKQHYDEWQTSTKNELLEIFPEEDREIYSKLDIDALKKLSQKQAAAVPGTNKGIDKSIKAGKFGGYESLSEWARRDPKGYKQARDEGRIRPNA